MARFVFILIALALVACSSTKDVSQDPKSKTDFTVGGVYRLKVGVLVYSFDNLLMPLGSLESPTGLEEARKKLPLQVDALLEPGTLLQVRRVVASNNPMVGKITDVYAVVLNGPVKDRTVNLRTISRDDWNTGLTKRNADFLEPVEREP